MSDNLLGQAVQGITSGTANSWRRLIEELSKIEAGKVMVIMDGRAPQAICRMASAQRLTEDVRRREVER